MVTGGRGAVQTVVADVNDGWRWSRSRDASTWRPRLSVPRRSGIAAGAGTPGGCARPSSPLAAPRRPRRSGVARRRLPSGALREAPPLRQHINPHVAQRLIIQRLHSDAATQHCAEPERRLVGLRVRLVVATHQQLRMLRQMRRLLRLCIRHPVAGVAHQGLIVPGEELLCARPRQVAPWPRAKQVDGARFVRHHKSSAVRVPPRVQQLHGTLWQAAPQVKLSLRNATLVRNSVVHEQRGSSAAACHGGGRAAQPPQVPNAHAAVVAGSQHQPWVHRVHLHHKHLQRVSPHPGVQVSSGGIPHAHGGVLQ